MRITKDVIIFVLQYTLLSVCECVMLPDCDPSKLSNCFKIKGIECNSSTKKCECSSGYEYHPDSPDKNTTCVKYVPNPASPDDNSHTTSVVVVILLTLLLLGSALFFIVRRYNLLHWVHNKIFSNRRNTGATYEDVMIGQDDPPITA